MSTAIAPGARPTQPRAGRDVKAAAAGSEAKSEAGKARQGVLFAVHAGPHAAAQASPVRKSRKLSATTAQLAAQARWHSDLQSRGHRWWLGGSPFLTVALAGSVLFHLI